MMVSNATEPQMRTRGSVIGGRAAKGGDDTCWLPADVCPHPDTLTLRLVTPGGRGGLKAGFASAQLAHQVLLAAADGQAFRNALQHDFPVRIAVFLGLALEAFDQR